MNILLKYASAEIVIKNSKFLAEIFPVKTQSEAREFLKKQKQKYADATHVVHAFVLGSSGEILGCSDDGEPSGTAGKPALTVLKNSGITNIMLTIMRKFGGILLGTGGLVKAYTDSAKAVLQKAETEPFTEKLDCKVFCSYPKYELIKNKFDDFLAEIKAVNFKEEIEINLSIPKDKKNALCSFLENAAKGGSAIRFLIAP